MAAFPVFESMSVSNYGLYPGVARDGQFKINFQPGLTLVLGANGLGKSTLMSMLFRMLTGPFDLNLPNGSIGTSAINAEALGNRQRTAFGARVTDWAGQATATLAFGLGPRRFVVRRSLKDLKLTSLTIDDCEQPTDENTFQSTVSSAASLATFGEWILVLRTMIFFFEDRRALVWDASAQRQLLRCLFLPPKDAQEWAIAEREILELDTRMRNLQAALQKEKRVAETIKYQQQEAPGVREALEAAQSSSAILREKLDALSERIEICDQTRHRLRLDALRAQAAHDDALQELERARLWAVESKFPTADSSMRYILSRLMADDLCLVCNSSGRIKTREELSEAIDRSRCVLCGADVSKQGSSAVDITTEAIERLRQKVSDASRSAEASKTELASAVRDYESVGQELSQTSLELTDLKSQINTLVDQLPPEEQKARRQHEALAAMEERVQALRADLRVKRQAFAATMNAHRDAIRQHAEQIRVAFQTAAKGFLLEDSSLSWAPTRTQVGQAGADGLEPVEYPAFAVELTGSNFQTLVRRDGPEQVSESQREFIDLAFRVALMSVAAPERGSTLLIDAPESSLDPVFVQRAANVLARFANGRASNRLIVTSNLAASDLIPRLLIAAEEEPTNRAGRIVDLFRSGVPTRAMQEMQAEYGELLSALYGRLAEA